MRVGSIILGAFAAGWGLAALLFAGQVNAFLALPILVSALLIRAVWRLPPMAVSAEEAKRVGRLVMWASMAEGLGIPVAINLVVWLGRPDLQVAAVAGVVGLHFLPLARLMPLRGYYFTGLALLLLALGGGWLGGGTGKVVICAGAALTLWLTLWGRIRAARTRLA